MRWDEISDVKLRTVSSDFESIETPGVQTSADDKTILCS